MSELACAAGVGGSELLILQMGEEVCSPGYAYGPHVRDHVLIHFVHTGRGVFHYSGRTETVSAGQGFLILPGEETVYQADERDPWHYAWVGYRGEQAQAVTRVAGLDERHRVFTATHPQEAWQALAQMREDARSLRLLQMAAVGSLLRFLSLIAPLHDDMRTRAAAQYCEKARWYLEGRYDQSVSIQDAADFVGLSRSQLYRVMMAECGCSPKTMLLHIRMGHARQLLTTTPLTLEKIAHRVGLQTGAQLSAAFRSLYGIPPGQYRRTGSLPPGPR
ncbi:MAG: AraC family ligand binding domain-containing protein [Aristaeellaceae bacterium]